MSIKEENLVILNAKNRVQHVLIQLDRNPLTDTYQIIRVTDQFGGKKTDQPIIHISNGKVTRTVAEQATLQYNAIVKNYLDKGYVKIQNISLKPYNKLTEEEIKKGLGGSFISDQSGVPKPMLAKSADKCTSGIWNKDWYVSRKLDGCRALMYFKDNLIQVASRGGGNYNAATKHLREDPIIKALFKQNPDLILDGELYKHGTDWPLQRISGLVRQQEWKPECGEIEYWIYDYVDIKTPFKERVKVLESMSTLFDPTSLIKVVSHKLISGYKDAKSEHDTYVKEGFEGLCARNPEKEYGINKRSALYLIKLKEYQDAEFRITGVRTGLRPEDMCFTLKTDDGKEFAAKPMGTAETRQYYVSHPQEFINKYATCKFFYYSSDGIPIQPILKHIRPEGE